MATVKSIKLPKYHKQKRKGQNLAFAELNGHRHYLGTYGGRESRQRYEQLFAEWLENGKRLPVDPGEITVVEITARFWEYAQRHYRRADKTPTCEPNNIRQALRPLKKLYGYTLAKNFGPLALKAVRQKMIEKRWCRTNINKMISKIKLMFRWAIENELVNPSVYHGLQAVSGLKYGRSGAKEKEPVKPVPDRLVEGALDQMTPTLIAMVELQKLTGMRPCDVCIIRHGDIDISKGHLTVVGRKDSAVGYGDTVNVTGQIIKDCAGALDSRFRMSKPFFLPYVSRQANILKTPLNTPAKDFAKPS